MSPVFDKFFIMHTDMTLDLFYHNKMLLNTLYCLNCFETGEVYNIIRFIISCEEQDGLHIIRSRYTKEKMSEYTGGQKHG